MHSLLGDEYATYGLTMAQNYEDASRLLNEMIVACLDEHAVHRAAAEVTDSHDARAHLRYSAGRRADFAKELATIVRALGASANDAVSTGEWLRATMLSLRGKIFGKNARAAAEACVRVDARVDALYAVASKAGLPDRARAAIVRQHAELLADREAFRQLLVSSVPA